MSKEEETNEKIEQIEEGENNDTKFTINSPMGDVSVDMLEYEAAKKSAKKQVNPPELSLLTQKVQRFLGGQEQTDFRYFKPRLGSLIKLHIDDEFSDYELVKEFYLHGGIEYLPFIQTPKWLILLRKGSFKWVLDFIKMLQRNLRSYVR